MHSEDHEYLKDFHQQFILDDQDISILLRKGVATDHFGVLELFCYQLMLFNFFQSKLPV